MSSYIDRIRKRQQEDLPDQVTDSEYLEKLRNAEGEEFDEAVNVHMGRLGRYVLYSQDREEHSSEKYAQVQYRRKQERSDDGDEWDIDEDLSWNREASGQTSEETAGEENRRQRK